MTAGLEEQRGGWSWGSGSEADAGSARGQQPCGGSSEEKRTRPFHQLVLRLPGSPTCVTCIVTVRREAVQSRELVNGNIGGIRRSQGRGRGQERPRQLASQVGRGFEEGLASAVSSARVRSGKVMAQECPLILAKISGGSGGQSPVGTGMLSGSAGKWAELVQASVPEAARLDIEGHVV